MAPSASAPGLSVLVVTYNSAATMGRVLQSLPWADLPGLRAVVVDNASTDDTRDQLAAFTPPNGGTLLPIFNDRNRFFAAAVNQGLARAQGDDVLLVGHDCFLEPGAVRTLRDWMARHPDVGVVAPRLVDEAGRLHPSCRNLPTWRDLFLETCGLPRLAPGRFTPPWKQVDLETDIPIDVEQPEASCLLIRREALDRVGPMDTRFPLFFNDVDWCRRFMEAGWRIVYLPAARAVHLKGASIYARRASTIWHSHQGFYRYVRKNKQPGPLPRLLLIFASLMLVWTALLRWLGVLLMPRLRRRL